MQSAFDSVNYYRDERNKERERLAKLVAAADDLHRITVLEFGHRPEWQTLGRILNEISPKGFDRVTGDPTPTSPASSAMGGRDV